MSPEKINLISKIESYRQNLDREANGINWLREITRSSVTIIVAAVYGLVIWCLVKHGIEITSSGTGDLTGIFSLGDLVNKLLLPVVTLVLGFYYGTQKT